MSNYNSWEADCHGGLTYASYNDPPFEGLDKGLWLGWDYAHLGDAEVLYFDGHYEVRGNGKFWTTEEIVEEAKTAIDTLWFAPADQKPLPSAHPEIVRCKDCKYMTERYDTDGNAPYWTCSEWDSGTDYDGFCHYAERRTDD